MEKEKFLQSIKETLETAGFLVDDLVQYCAEKEVSTVNTLESGVSVVGASSKENEGRFPFEVMYEGMVRSWVPLEGKKPLGVIFKNHLITLHDSPKKVDWEEAMEYCQEIKIEGHVCEAGKLEFWKELVLAFLSQREALDDLLVSLGGTALAEKWRWSSSERSRDYAWVFCMYNGISCGYVNDGFKSCCDVVRPVLDLSELSF